jgi:hypothetical protein
MKKFITGIVLLASSLFIWAPCSLAETGQLQVLLRYDDFVQSSDYSIEQTLFNELQKGNGGILVGIIPFLGKPCPVNQPISRDSLPLDQKKRALIKQFHDQGVVEVAVHGCNHSNNKKTATNSEFSGLPRAEQENILKMTKKSLEMALEFPVTAFVPPYNTYDDNTLIALAETGFTLLSAGPKGPALDDSPLNFLPGGPYPYKLRTIMKTALANDHRDALIVVTMHPYDISGTGRELPTFRKKDSQISIGGIIDDLQWVARTPNIRLTTLHELQSNGDLSLARLQANQRLRNSLVTVHALAPDIFSVYPLTGLYYSEAAADKMYIKQAVLAAGFHLFLLIASLLISNYLLNTTGKYRTPARYIMIAASLLAIAAIIVRSSSSGFYLTSAIIIIVSLGALMATAGKTSKTRHQAHK